jgi:serine/threonine-protein kinase
MSPEQAKGGPADARTDVYAAGVLLFELLAGRRPFVDPTYEGIIIEHLTQPVPSLVKVRPGQAAAPLFQAVVEKAMAKKPSARFKDAAVMLAAVETAMAKLPPEATRRGRAEARRKPTPHALNTRSAGSRLWRRAIMLVMVAAAIGAGGTYLLRDRAATVETAKRPAKAPPKSALPPKPSASASVSPSPAPKPTVAPAPPTSALPPLPKPEPATAPAPQAHAPADDDGPAEQPEQPEKERQPRSAARNPWKAPVPRALRPIRQQLDRGAHMSQKALRPAYEFAHENPGDPRPWLLLGHAYAQVDWFSDAVERYVRAHRVDSTCRGDPQMLADLLKGAAHPTAGRAAARAIRDIYGAEAIPALEKEMKRRAGEREASARLTRLRESLPR